MYFPVILLLCCASDTPKPHAMKPVDRLSDDEFADLVQRAATLPDAPSALVRAAIDLWPAALQTAPLKDASQAAWRLVSAVLSFDSWAGPRLAPGMRSAASDTRHLLFNAMGRDIDLRISPAAGGFALTGQVLGPDESGSIELAPQSGAAAALSSALDALGEFRLDAVQGGTYRMTLRLGRDEVVLPPIEVGPRS